MPWSLIIFYGLAAVSLLCAAGVVIARNPVHAGGFLILTFFNVAAIFVMLGAEFLAAVQVIVYAGAILVLVLFTLILVDPDDLPEFHGGRPVQRAVGLLLGLVLLLQVGVAIVTRTVVGQPGSADAIEATLGGNTQGVGYQLYVPYLLAFEVISLVLLVGIIGAIVLALPERLGERIAQRRSGTISLGHPRGAEPALTAGPVGETPVSTAAGDEPLVTAAGGRREEPGALEATRELIMVDDADSYTEVGGRRSEVGGRPPTGRNGR